MGDYAVKVTVRNGRLLRKIREAGYSSQTEFAHKLGFSVQTLNALVTMRYAAFNQSGEWRQIVWDISSALHCEPEDLFNEQQRRQALERNSGEVYMDAEQIQQIMIGGPENSAWAKLHVKKLLEAIPTDRARNVIKSRFMDNATLEDLAQEYGVTRGRMKQIEANALRKMKSKAASQGFEYARYYIQGDSDA